MNSFNSQVQQESEVPYSPETETETTRNEEKVILASARPKKRAGRRVFKETRHPVYRGVRRRDNNKWVCEMRVPNNNSRIWLGTYPTPEMAARAHDVAALALRGNSACLNFADSPSRLSVPATTDPHQIRQAAFHAAHSFASQECHQHHTANELPPPLPQGNMQHVDQVQQCHDLLLSIADEPLMSPPPSPSARYGSHWNDDLNIVDAEVSLWNFSI